MLTNDLFNTDYERRLQEGAVDRLEQRRIDDLNMKMDELANRVKSTSNPEHKKSLLKAFLDCKEERDSYYKLREGGIGQDIANKSEKMARATPPTKAGAVASTVKNAAKWLAGKGGPGKEGPTYEGAEDIEDRGEYDREGDMAKDNIHTIVRNARELESVIGNNDNLPEWVQDKLANIKGMMTAVSEYMQTQHEREGAIPEGTETQWSKEEPWTKVPKNKAGRPVDPRGEVAHLSDVARRQAERKAQAQKKNSEKVDEHGGGIGPKQHWQDLMPEGFQDFNKVEPYAVCLAGKPVKKFDYYEEARRFHDNWKQKLYREGDKAKADKITLLPLGLDEDTGSWIVYDPATKQIKKRFKTHTAGKSYAKVHNLGFASSEYYFDNIKDQKSIAEAGDRVDPILLKALKRMPDGLATHGQVLNAAYDAYAMELGYLSMRGERRTTDEYTTQLMQLYKDKHGLTFNEAANPAQQAAIAVAMKKAGKKPKSVDETVTDVRPGMAKIYNKLAPKIERHKDSFLAGQLYDELEAYAELHGAEVEFKRMMNGARNRAHMDYDTNPGGFQNWFWYLPFADEVAEEKTRLDPKCWTGKKIGNPKTKVKGGVRVNNCVPAEESYTKVMESQGVTDPTMLDVARRIDLFAKTIK